MSTKNLGPIGSAVSTVIGYKQTNKQTDKPNLYIDINTFNPYSPNYVTNTSANGNAYTGHMTIWTICNIIINNIYSKCKIDINKL